MCKKVHIDEVVEKYCNENTPEDVVAVIYRIFHEFAIFFPEGAEIEVDE